VTGGLPNEVEVVECVEYGHINVDPLIWVSDNHRAVFSSEIDGRRVLQATVHEGQLRLQATSYVGVIPLNDQVIVRVRPRFPIANLTRMVTDTGHQHIEALTAFRDYSTQGTADDWTMDLYADALLDYVDDLLDKGLHRVYVHREDEGHFPHGRIDVNRTVQRFAARGIPNKAAYSWFERTVDTPANRCVKAAMEVVYGHLTKKRPQQRKGGAKRLARLVGQMAALEEVNNDPDWRFMDDPQVLGLDPLPDPRAYYRAALDLSVAILRGAGITLDVSGRDVQLASQLIDTNKLFERFVRVSLEKYGKRHGWPVKVLDGNTDGSVTFYDVPNPLPAPFGEPLEALASRDPGRAQPDVVFRAADGTFPLVAEVKNKRSSDDALPDRDDVEQAVTYALRYGLTTALLIHPWSRGRAGLVYVGRVRNVDVYDYRLDLSLHDDLDEALADMGRTVARLAGLS